MTIKVNKEFFQRVEGFASNGTRTKDIYLSLGMSSSTFHRKMQDPEFKELFEKAESEGLAKGVQGAAHHVQELIKGVRVEAEKVFIGKDGEVVRVDTYKKYKPDFKACLVFLINFGGWKDKKQIELLDRELKDLGGISGAIEAIRKITGSGDSECPPGAVSE